MSNEFTIYADFNCVHCYSLFQGLKAIGLEQVTKWCFIEHRQDLVSQRFDLNEQARLSQDVYDAALLSPALHVNLPLSRPNTWQAIELYTKTVVYFPDKALSVADAIFSALWQDGIDIADPDFLRTLAERFELAHLLNTPSDPEVQESRMRWQYDWQLSKYRMQTPVLLSPQEQFLVGPQSHKTIVEFFINNGQNSELILEEETTEDKPVIVCYTDMLRHKDFINAMAPDYHLLIARDPLHLVDFIHSPTPVDKLVIDARNNALGSPHIRTLLKRHCKLEGNESVDNPSLLAAFLSEHLDEQALQIFFISEHSADELSIYPQLTRISPESYQADIIALLHADNSEASE